MEDNWWILIGVVIFAVLFKIFSKYYSPRISLFFYPKYANLDRNLKIKWDSHMVSTVHATVVTIAAAYLIAYDEKMAARPEGPSGFRVRLLTGFSSGYFLHDLVMMIRYHYLFGKKAELAHHVISLAGTCYITMTGQMPLGTCIQLLHELSTPLVNVRWFILTSGIGEERKRYKTVCVLMMVLFFICRIATIPWFWASALPVIGKRDTVFETVFVATLIVTFGGMDVLNLHWFRLMTRILRNVVKDKIHEIRSRKQLHFTFEESDSDSNE